MDARAPNPTNRRRLRAVGWRMLAVAALLAGCSHDWSPAADADTTLETDGELPDTPPDGDGPETHDVDAVRDDMVAVDDVSADDVAADDAAVDDAPPPECDEDSDCDDGDPCTADACDVSGGRCRFTVLPDDSPCGTDAICCGGSCVSSREVGHCGSCDTVCPEVPHAVPTCTDVGCGFVCDEGYLDCESTVDDGCETERSEDELHCGDCDIACNDGQTCVAGVCTPSWRTLSGAGDPSARRYPQGFWTGREFLVFGGYASGACYTVGGAYDPATDSWRRMADASGTLTGCSRAAMAWSGTALLVWGGSSGGGDSTAESGGGRYDPLADAWTPITRLGDPTDRMSAAAVWSGTELIVWGGARNPTAVLADGGRYDPAADRWSPVTATGAPTARWSASAVWTGSELLVWGGFLDDDGTPTNTGGRYDPATDGWRPLASAGAPSARGAAPAVWTGSEMLVWGGGADAGFSMGIYSPLGNGAAYDPATDSWRPLGAAPLDPRHSHAAVWLGGAMLVWGGTRDYVMSAFDDGALYDPATDRWTSMTTVGAPQGRRSFAAAWSGSEFLVWGGADQVTGVITNLSDGGAYRPR
ncbi:MAG: hypothetical protein JXB32_05230 [Deltaproteobacteria bacterium]|nr:hypothetical protein [Deltaproteobacteria bacterium]